MNTEPVVGLHNLTRGLWSSPNGLYWVESNNPIEDYETEVWYGVLYFNKHRKSCPLNPEGDEYRSVLFTWVDDQFVYDFARNCRRVVGPIPSLPTLKGDIMFLSEQHKRTYDSWLNFQTTFANAQENEYWFELGRHFGGAGMDIWYISQRSRFDPNMVYELLNARKEGRYYPDRITTGDYNWDATTGRFSPK